PGGGGSPFELYPSIPQKKLRTTSAPLEAVCYVDVEQYNPLNAKDYVFAASADTPETQFFNYVVLGYSYLTRDAGGYTHLELTGALRYILENSVTYIKPLHLKGIKVLVEVRNGVYDDENDEGIGAGLGTMDMASINEFIKELKLLVNEYGVDGFDFNDTGGGKNSYPPYTRNLKQFQSDLPLYPDSLFVDDAGVAPLSAAEIDDVLWLEGGSNFSNLIQRTNETLKETYTSVWKNGSEETSEVQSVDRIILVRNRGHGSHLISQLRMAYMPDAYSGADPKITGNLRFIVNDAPYDTTNPHAPLWDEARKRDVGAEEADNVYIPFAVDLSDQKARSEAEDLAKAFLSKDLDPDNLNPVGNPEGGSTPAPEYSSYGALFFTNLRPVSEAAGTLTYINYFSREIFRRTVALTGASDAGDYKKTW
ncbi:MAG: hypothetical protein LBF74_04990, partial [Treponema sp.]|nr:hypothetical protein [Treponema sp.]